MADPRAFGDPDHYAIRYTGPEDNGGVHINSGIVNHAFYLAIEGGTNRTSGLAVTGVGGGNREQIERMFYRGFTSYLTPSATFAMARQATLRAATDLFGGASPAFRAVSRPGPPWGSIDAPSPPNVDLYAETASFSSNYSVEPSVDVDAGGALVGGGLRLRF